MKKRHYNTILFDWDGCIANSLPLWHTCFHQVFKQLNISMTDEDILSISTQNTKKVTDFGVSTELFNSTILAEAPAYMSKVELHEGASIILKSLKKLGKHIALVTSSFRETVVPMMKRHGIHKYFDTIITAEDVKKPKPDPEGLKKTITFLNARPEETLFVGDSDNDIKAGKKLRIDTVLFTPTENYSYHRIDYFLSLKPTYHISDPSELAHIIL